MSSGSRVLLEPKECFELLKTLYDLSDSGDLYHASFDKHLVQDLGLTQSVAVPSMYFHFKDGILIGINSTYVEDL